MHFLRKLRILRAGNCRSELPLLLSSEPSSSARAVARVARLWRSNMSSSSSVYRRGGGEGFILHLYIFDSDATVDRAYLLNICERKLMSK